MDQRRYNVYAEHKTWLKIDDQQWQKAHTYNSPYRADRYMG